MRAARALLNIDQRGLAEQSGLSVPTIQRMEASDDVIRGNVDRSEERRVGKECRSRGAPEHGKKKEKPNRDSAKVVRKINTTQQSCTDDQLERDQQIKSLR